MNGPSPTGSRQDIVEISDPARLPLKPVVSVLMVTYNHGPYISQAIDGVLMQRSDFPFELLIGEDCSSDNTRETVLRYQRQHPEVIRVLISERNAGANENARRLFEASRGAILAFCEGDDYWTAADKLSRQVAVFAARPDVSMCFHAARILDQATQRLSRIIGFGRKPRDYSLEEIITGGGGMIPSASITLRASALHPIDDWVLRSPVGDYPLAIWAASRGIAHSLPESMAVYRIGHAGSWSASIAVDPAKDLAVRCGIIRMLEPFPVKSGRMDARPAVEQAIRMLILDFAVDYGSIALRGVPEVESNRPSLTWADRFLLFAFNDPKKIRMRGAWFIRSKWRHLKKFGSWR